MLISDFSLQTDARNLDRNARHAHEPGGYGSFRLPEGTLLRHHRGGWFAELLTGFQLEETVERDWVMMNGNPARIVQLWCRKKDNNPHDADRGVR